MRRRLARSPALIAVSVLLGLAAATAGAGEPRHAIAMHGEPAYPPGFSHFRYANPDPPKGGRLTQAMTGSFDSLNPMIVRGNAFQYVRGYVIESLLARGNDEPFTLYGLIAESVETDAERTYVAFHLDPRARFSDGRPVTAEDVLFSWQLLRDKGRPNHRGYYSKVAKAEKTGERTVRFDFGSERDRELPLILGLMPVLPRHAIDAEKFEETTLQAPIGSGPYRVAEIKPGESVLLKRDPNYWGRELAVNRGHYNFDELRFDFYRDGNTWFEAFKRGLYDVRFETDPGRWATQYNFPAARSQGLIREGIASGQPKPMQAFVFNARRPPFADARVREALIELFDFEWANANLFYGAYQRTASFFEGSELSARGRPADARERDLLAPFRDEIRGDVMEGRYEPPVSDGSGRDRARLKRALELLGAAGYALRNGTLVSPSGEPFAFEIMVATRDEERLALAYSSMLRRAGIAAGIRFVDGAQFERRRQNYDFDVMPYIWQQSLSPGNEQAFYFGSDSADVPGTRNYMGAKSPAVDAMIAALLAARQRQDFVAAVRALDRALISGLYVLPLFHLPEQWIARWPGIERPKQVSLYGSPVETWWREGKR
ncbi:MAG: ABC transporter substrate-binding protein [Bradyrhizobiaceae bacterium]|nr:ABC transporter substrate-binding protein [Bradyrhizobiaceae bacterium]